MLTLNNITYQVPDENDPGTRKVILDHISLDIEDGKFLVITGPNGSGKSTLAKTIAGIYPVSSGSILLDGKDITGASVTSAIIFGSVLLLKSISKMS